MIIGEKFETVAARGESIPLNAEHIYEYPKDGEMNAVRSGDPPALPPERQISQTQATDAPPIKAPAKPTRTPTPDKPPEPWTKPLCLIENVVFIEATLI